MITGYDHFAQLAESLQWDEMDIDYSADREAWPQLTDAENAKVLGLIAGFVRDIGVPAARFLPGGCVRRLDGGSLPRPGP